MAGQILPPLLLQIGAWRKLFCLRNKALRKWIKGVGSVTLLAEGVSMALSIPLLRDKSYYFVTVLWQMAQRHSRVYKTSKCSSESYASHSLTSDFMGNKIDVIGWKNWQSPLVSDQAAKMTWFDPGYLLAPRWLMCVICETAYILIPNLCFSE